MEQLNYSSEEKAHMMKMSIYQTISKPKFDPDVAEQIYYTVFANELDEALWTS